MAKKKHYVNNPEFYQALVEWELAGKPIPIPDYITECIMVIVRRYSSKPNFASYTYIEDMRSEAIEHCIRYCDRFNVKKYNNPFAYFTQITYHAFLQFIAKEGRLAEYKFNLVKDQLYNAQQYDRNFIVGSNHNEDGDPVNEDGEILMDVKEIEDFDLDEDPLILEKIGEIGEIDD